MVDKEKMSELYMHNLVLTNLNIWDPNPRMGDMKLMALASWMVNEETRVKEMRMVMRRENIEPLHIRAEHFSPRGVINNHIKIEKYHEFEKRYLHTQSQAMNHFNDVSRLLGDECIMASQRRWNNLPHNLRNMEYHTPEILRDALEGEEFYNRALQAKKIQ